VNDSETRYSKFAVPTFASHATYSSSLFGIPFFISSDETLSITKHDEYVLPYDDETLLGYLHG
jgi:hypothetical protein